MNERIKQLADEAKISNYLSSYGPEFKYAFEKFAELIVQELVEVLDERHKTFKGSGNEYSRGFKSGLDAATRTVKARLGVEE